MAPTRLSGSLTRLPPFRRVSTAAGFRLSRFRPMPAPELICRDPEVAPIDHRAPSRVDQTFERAARAREDVIDDFGRRARRPVDVMPGDLHQLEDPRHAIDRRAGVAKEPDYSRPDQFEALLP